MTEKKIKIKIKSVQSDLVLAESLSHLAGKPLNDEINEDIEYVTEGILRDKGETIEISYEESEAMGLENSVTTLIFEKDKPNLINMVRSGNNTAGLVFNADVKRQPCAYNVGGFPIEFCIYTRKISNSVSVSGGRIELDYIIEIHGTKTERNRFSIDIKELKGEGRSQSDSFKLGRIQDQG